MWISITDRWPDPGRKHILITSGDLTVRALTVRIPTKSYPMGIIIPEYARSFFKHSDITHWIYVANLPYMEFLHFFPNGNHDKRI
jgi:hypothetical protein